MPGGSGLAAIPVIREGGRWGPPSSRRPTKNDPSFARQALRGGALGFVLKEAAHESSLLGAIRLAATDGETYLNPVLGPRLAAQPSEPPGAARRPLRSELEVLKLIALGHTNC